MKQIGIAVISSVLTVWAFHPFSVQAQDPARAYKENGVDASSITLNLAQSRTVTKELTEMNRHGWKAEAVLLTIPLLGPSVRLIPVYTAIPIPMLFTSGTLVIDRRGHVTLE